MELKTCEKINKGKGKIITWKGVLHDNIELIKVGSKFDSEAHGAFSFFKGKVTRFKAKE